jgi:hypothetical protein
MAKYDEEKLASSNGRSPHPRQLRTEYDRRAAHRQSDCDRLAWEVKAIVEAWLPEQAGG